MIRILVIFNLCWLFLSTVCPASSEQVEVPSSPESLRLRAIQGQKRSLYQDQSYPSQKMVEVKNPSRRSFSSSAISSASYPTRSFLGMKNAWIGKKIALDEVKPAWSGSQRQLEEKVFPTRSCSMASGFRMDRATTLATSSYPTKRFYPDAKAQGGLDHDFQQALQKAKSPQEVREILERK